MFGLLKKGIILKVIMSTPLTWGYCLYCKKSRMCCKKSNY